jgi:iron complex outermembrane recepter protein
VPGSIEQPFRAFSTEHDYEGWLSSLNLVADVTDDLLIRGSVAKVITRPEFGFLSPGANVVISGTPSINSGNPWLEPIRATTFDAAIELYFRAQLAALSGLFPEGYRFLGASGIAS